MLWQAVDIQEWSFRKQFIVFFVGFETCSLILCSLLSTGAYRQTSKVAKWLFWRRSKTNLNFCYRFYWLDKNLITQNNRWLIFLTLTLERSFEASYPFEDTSYFWLLWCDCANYSRLFIISQWECSKELLGEFFLEFSY